MKYECIGNIYFKNDSSSKLSLGELLIANANHDYFSPSQTNTKIFYPEKHRCLNKNSASLSQS